MLIGFALPVIMIVLSYLPFILNVFGDSFSYSSEYQDVVSIMTTMLLFALTSMILYFLLIPILLNYVYEAAQGNVEKGWFKRGLKRNWWKMFVTGLISSIPLYIIYGIFFAVVFILVSADALSAIAITIGFALFAILLVFWSAFLYTAFVSVAAEEKFEVGFKNIFKVGFKNIFKVTLAIIVSTIPSVLLGAVLGFYITTSYSPYLGRGSAYISYQILQEQWFLPIVIAAVILITALNAVVMSFIYVYTTKHYIKRRQEILDSAPIEAA